MLNIMIFFSILGGIDKIFNNRFGLGEKFDEGFKALGGLALTIIGIYSLSPLIAKGVTPLLYPLAKLMKTDPSVFIGSILAPDLGGFPTSMEIARNDLIGSYNGIILSSTLGTLISFTLPVAVGLISKEDLDYFARGVLAGIIAVPFAMILGGVMMGLSFRQIFSSLLPVLAFSILLVLGLVRSRQATIRIFNMVGRVIIGLSSLGLILGIIQFMFGLQISPDLIGIEEGAILIVKIGIILSGAYPMFTILSRILQKYLNRLGNRFQLDQYSILGLFSSLANSIPMLGIYDKMNERGKVINAAFSVSAAYSLGGQLGYISTVAPEAVNPFILSKLFSGLMAIIIALWIMKLEEKREVI